MNYNIDNCYSYKNYIDSILESIHKKCISYKKIINNIRSIIENIILEKNFINIIINIIYNFILAGISFKNKHYNC